jgi:hypothetical protein
MEDWRPIQDFQNYSVSDEGRVLNVSTGRVMLLSENQRQLAVVGLMRSGVQYKRVVSRLVADEFLPSPRNEAFDSVINLDGDRRNNYATNLMWRPRWFVPKYQAQFFNRTGSGMSVFDLETGEEFATMWEAAIRYGILVRHIYESATLGTNVWPTGQYFARL